MEDYMNLRGKELYLCQHNLKAMVPVLNQQPDMDYCLTRMP